MDAPEQEVFDTAAAGDDDDDDNHDSSDLMRDIGSTSVSHDPL